MSSDVTFMQFPHQTGGIGATIDDRLVTMEKIVQRAVIKIEERSQNDVILIDGWQGWMPSTVEGREERHNCRRAC